MGRGFGWLKRTDKKAHRKFHELDAKVNELHGDIYSATSTILGNSIDEAVSYKEAARDYVTAGKLKDAIKNYEKAAKVYGLAGASYLKSQEQGTPKYNKGKEYLKEAVECTNNAERLKRVRSGKWHGLEGKAAAVVSIGGIASGLLFMSSNITGNAIADIPLKTTSFIGTLLFIVGLIAGHYWFKNK